MQTANVLDPTEKKNVMWKFEKGSLDQAMQIWKQIEANKSKP
jgi:hypothetical protein